MRLILVVSAMVALASCATVTPVVEPFVTPDGRAGHVVYCGGASLEMNDCHIAARATCAGNYEVVSSSESQRVVGDLSTENRRIEFICRPS